MNKKAPYFQVAKIVLIKYKDYTEKEAENFIESSDVKEIEIKCNAKNSVLAATMHIAGIFKLDPEKTEIFKNDVLGLNNQTQIIDYLKGECIKKFPAGAITFVKGESTLDICDATNMKEDFIISILEAVHNQWIRDNELIFFTKKTKQEEQYQYLPIEYIGWKEVKIDLLFVKPILDAIEICFTEDGLRLAYYNRVANYFNPINNKYKWNGTWTNMGRYIVDSLMYNNPWNEYIAGHFSNQLYVEAYILPQLRKKGFASDPDLIRYLRERKIWIATLKEETKMESWSRYLRRQL